MLLGLAVTLTFKVAALMLHSSRRLNMVIIHVKKFLNLLQITKLWARHDFAERSCCDLNIQGRTRMGRMDGQGGDYVNLDIKYMLINQQAVVDTDKRVTEITATPRLWKN